jgi:hypothetical protein
MVLQRHKFSLLSVRWRECVASVLCVVDLQPPEGQLAHVEFVYVYASWLAGVVDKTS